MAMQHASGYSPDMADEELTEAISLRISKEDRTILDELAKRFPMKPLSIARVAIRLGMEELLKNPSSIFLDPAKRDAAEWKQVIDAKRAERRSKR